MPLPGIDAVLPCMFSACDTCCAPLLLSALDTLGGSSSQRFGASATAAMAAVRASGATLMPISADSMNTRLPNAPRCCLTGAVFEPVLQSARPGTLQSAAAPPHAAASGEDGHTRQLLYRQRWQVVGLATGMRCAPHPLARHHALDVLRAGSPHETWRALSMRRPPQEAVLWVLAAMQQLEGDARTAQVRACASA